MNDAGLILLILKIAVGAVTILWLASLLALAAGRIRLHGRINMVFFVLTLTAVLGLEVIIRIINRTLLNDYLKEHQAEGMLTLHLCFSMPAAALLFIMLFTGLKHYRGFHIATGILFSLLWIGTFITGIFFLPPW